MPKKEEQVTSVDCPEDMGMVVHSKEYAYWKQIKESLEREKKQMETSLELCEANIQYVEDKLCNIEKKEKL